MSTEMHGRPEERTGIEACQSMEGNVVHLYTTVVNLSANLQLALTRAIIRLIWRMRICPAT